MDSLLFETIRIEAGQAHHLDFHNARLNRSRKALFGCRDAIDLNQHFADLPRNGLYRAKVIYGQQIENIAYYPYQPRVLTQLALVASTVDYAYKYLDRSPLDALLGSKPDADDIIIVKNGLLSDSSIANIALRRNSIWYTPAIPLLEGTTRARLIEDGTVRLADIPVDAIDAYDGIALMNAMIGFSQIDNLIITRE